VRLFLEAGAEVNAANDVGIHLQIIFKIIFIV
jgi:hypothetical protein